MPWPVAGTGASLCFAAYEQIRPSSPIFRTRRKSSKRTARSPPNRQHYTRRRCRSWAKRSREAEGIQRRALIAPATPSRGPSRSATSSVPMAQTRPKGRRESGKWERIREIAEAVAARQRRCSSSPSSARIAAPLECSERRVRAAWFALHGEVAVNSKTPVQTLFPAKTRAPRRSSSLR